MGNIAEDWVIADKIAGLQVENEKLRKSLEPFADLLDKLEQSESFKADHVQEATVTVKELRGARKALGRKPKIKRRVSNYKTLLDRLNASSDELCLEAARCITSVRKERDWIDKVCCEFMERYDYLQEAAKLVIEKPTTENILELKERLRG